ncbi:molybdenum cofactor biosynthesis protein MoaE [Corynebacterium pacaense]|uniref:molybdenum cofactor biosynthesis protein MoaE n=1 Tax=Corynebacterium pacaense TaxID=1816684 RepID=UPI0009BB7F94|nr:molybdenum cofactor biosynthesis protein MoaE [Corynebacterium pacaense]
MTTDPARDGNHGGHLIDALISEGPLEELLPDARSATATAAMGAVITFEGVVRDHDGGHHVSLLTYTAHPSAKQVIIDVGLEVAAGHPHVRLWTAHRTGALRVGDVAFLVVAAAAHRREAFAACSALVDAVKAGVPIWKEQQLSDGSTEWVGL